MPKQTQQPKKVEGKKKFLTANEKKKMSKDARITKKKNPLFEKKPKNFSIGGGIRPKRDLTRYVKWPEYVRLQRQKRILLQRLKVPPTLNQFTKTLDKSAAQQLFKLLLKYKPESAYQKKKRLNLIAEAREKKETVDIKRPLQVQHGINHIATLVEQKKAKLVLIAHDVDPIEIVVWLPTLCRKMEVPYVIVKGKSRLGTVVRQKNATALAITDVAKEDVNTLKELTSLATESFNKNVELRRAWGGGKLGAKSMASLKRKEKAVQKEASKQQKASV